MKRYARFEFLFANAIFLLVGILIVWITLILLVTHPEVVILGAILIIVLGALAYKGDE